MNAARLDWLVNTLGMPNERPKVIKKRPELMHLDSKSSEYTYALYKIGRQEKYEAMSLDHQKILTSAIEDGSGVYESTRAFIEATLVHLHTGRRNSFGKPLLVEDGDQVISDALSGNHPCALIHVTDVVFDELEPLPSKEGGSNLGALIGYNFLSPAGKAFTGRNYSPSTDYHSSHHHVWTTPNVHGAFRWWGKHWSPQTNTKIKNGQYVYELSDDGSYTVVFIVHGYWFFRDNPDFHRFTQCRIIGG